MDDFNKEMCNRTYSLAVNINILLNQKNIPSVNRPVSVQLIKCSSSVGANFRAALRGRSYEEFYSKICIVTEECDEALYWINYLADSGLLRTDEIINIKKECEELLKIFSKTRRTAKKKLEMKKKK